MTDEELDMIFPPGYEVVPPPANYAPVRKNVYFFCAKKFESQ